MSAIDSHLENFRQLGNGVPAFVRTLRQQGLDRFTTLGFPTTRMEDWKYTNLAPLARQAFRLPDASLPPAAAELAGALRLGAGVELVFINGHFAPTLSARAALPAGVIAGSLAQALREHAALLEPHLGRQVESGDDGLTALNTAFVSDGAFIHVPEGVAVDLAIHCLFISATANGATVTHPRNLIVAGAASRVTVIEQYAGAAEQTYWTNAVTEIAVGAGASVEHHRVQRESDRAHHVAAVAAAQAGDSSFTSRALSFGAALSRTAITTQLDAPGATCTLDGLYVAGGNQHVDHHTTIDHRRPHGTSRELYKGILDGRATGVFNGKVYVRADAQQSDAQQMNKNLLLSDDAQVDTKPQLEIFADDVKCSHGATIGQLDDDAIFYLRARGIDEPEARDLLVYAFANELIDRIAIEPLRAQMTRELSTRLRSALPLPGGRGTG